jgi:D-alanyl-D-alanine carboxypeptidase (penicillin-binding protein 5/6)
MTGVARIRRTALAFLLVALAWGALAPSIACAAKSSSPGLYVPSAILVSRDGTILWGKRPNAVRRPASCIKMLNALVVRDHANLNDVIRVSAKAAAVDGGAVGLHAGQKLTVRELLGVMLVHSANGAAEALATGIAGSEKAYLKLMNAKAKQLGCAHTIAADPHGLSPKNVTTASDLAIIARNLLDDPVLSKIVTQRSAWLPWGGYSTTDHLLGSYPGIEGVKTGYTDPAGYCFVGAAKHGDTQLIGVVLGADAPNDRFTQMQRLLNWGFAHTRVQRVVSADTTMGAVEVTGGEEDSVLVRPRGDVSMPVCDGGSKLRSQVKLPAAISAPVEAGAQVGSLQLVCGSRVETSIPLVAVQPVGVRPPAFAARHTVPKAAPGWPWRDLALVWAGLGRMLGI